MKTGFRRATLALPLCLAALLPLAASGQQPTRGPRCLVIGTIESWNPVDQWTVIMGSKGNNYHVTLANACTRMKWSVLARVDARTAARCLGPGDTLVFGRGSRLGDGRFREEDRCVVSQVTPIPTKPAL